MNSIWRTVPTFETQSTAAGNWRAESFLQAVLHRLNAGIALLDEDGTAVTVNNTFARMLETADRLVMRRGRIHATSAIENLKLQAAIISTGRHTRDQSVARNLPIWGSCNHVLIVSAIPIDDGSPSPDRSLPVMLLAVDTEPSAALDDQFLRDAFQLTDAEALVARRLVAGDTLAEIAGAKGISLHTARSQLKSIMLKLGVGRQSELVALLSRCDNVRRHAYPLKDRPAALVGTAAPAS